MYTDTYTKEKRGNLYRCSNAGQNELIQMSYVYNLKRKESDLD